MFFTKIQDLLLPPLCVHCGREGTWLCENASKRVESERVLINPLMITGVDRVVVRGSYDCEPLAQLIQKLKYHYWTGATIALHQSLAPLIQHLELDKRTVIIPVPLHGRRQRERGFNQSVLISQALSRLTRLPVNNLLTRTRYTTPQAKLSAIERTTNIVGAFDRHRVANRSRNKNGETPPAGGGWPKSVVLVDDVITTGSTIAECASVLRLHGVQKITAVALAKG